MENKEVVKMVIDRDRKYREFSMIEDIIDIYMGKYADYGEYIEAKKKVANEIYRSDVMQDIQVHNYPPIINKDAFDYTKYKKATCNEIKG